MVTATATLSVDSLSLSQRRAIRHACHAGCRMPIRIVVGNAHPHQVGEGYRWETIGGKPVYYPNAYRRAWGKPVYVPSSRCVEVGEEWVAEHCG
jgi:hypothetical protein